MSGNDLLVMVPTRGRREQCERLLKSFRETASRGTDLLLILDPDDEDTYDGVDWGERLARRPRPQGHAGGQAEPDAAADVDPYSALLWTGDDHVFSVPGWDQMMLALLEGIGGDGWVYPATARGSDVPEIWLASSSVTG